MNLSGRRALITGASGGLGHAIARALAARGATLVLSGRRVEVLEPLAEELGALPLACDLASAEDLPRLVAEAGPIDVLVANHALPASGTVAGMTVADIDRALDVNLRAPLVLARLLAEPMIARRSGHIVFVSSLAGKVASPGGALYSATKFGLRGFGFGLREDLRPHGVGVSVVSPGFIRDAGMFADSGARLPPGVGTKAPEDVALAVARAIEDDRAEIDVAPVALRLGAALGSVAPGPVSAMARRLGGDRVSKDIANGHSERR